MGATAVIAIAAAVPIRGVTDARPEMARGVAVEDRTAGAYETVRDRLTANRRPYTARGQRAYVHSREDGAANSCVMQTLDNHALDVIVQVRKFGERFDHPCLECSLESLAGARRPRILRAPEAVSGLV
jgi:hypothetical protein